MPRRATPTSNGSVVYGTIALAHPSSVAPNDHRWFTATTVVTTR
jgi:isocitrate dehydrogenase